MVEQASSENRLLAMSLQAFFVTLMVMDIGIE
jgi:hypothetical protein